MRITQSRLKTDLATINLNLAWSGSVYFFDVGGRNNYTALDLYVIDHKTGFSCHRNIEAGSAGDCFSALYRRCIDFHAEKQCFQKKANRLQAFGILCAYIDFTGDFHALDNEAVRMLLVWVKACKYRKPINAPHSTACAFFQSLKKVELKTRGNMRRTFEGF